MEPIELQEAIRELVAQGVLKYAQPTEKRTYVRSSERIKALLEQITTLDVALKQARADVKVAQAKVDSLRPQLTAKLAEAKSAKVPVELVAEAIGVKPNSASYRLRSAKKLNRKNKLNK